ncbi:GntR family transcriptional regulator (histidine utilization repressor-like) [Arenicella xantha]|uniref:GntR family transcriptional regulator (Histidine utilization repressor-like) n=2 Tax=Arenicella xantha TaxID=644221 RepID=A0A395JRT1_9GAMM|nr:GntR family transcriptional regulator (histidine utilization repressor-like) [Arenicella xantha]
MPGHKVASENKLSETFSVSRMTARRALDELSEAGFLFRSQGLGTFVADHRPMSSMVEIRNIAEEIRQRGHVCTVQVVAMVETEANADQAHWMGVKEASPLFRSVLVYFENAQAIQFEDRLVSPRLVPEYLLQDFSATTPNEYLSQVAPLTEADHIVEAILPSNVTAYSLADLLQIEAQAPCLKVTRRTYSKRGIVSFAHLIHPGERYRLGGHLNFS